MERIFWPLIVFSTINFVAALVVVFILKSNPLHLIGAVFIELIILFLAIARRFGRIDLYYLTFIPYLMIAAIPTVLVYKEWLPESLKNYPKSEYEYQILLNFIIVSAISLAHVKQTIFGTVPILLVVSFIQATEQAKFLHKEFEQLPTTFKKEV